MARVDWAPVKTAANTGSVHGPLPLDAASVGFDSDWPVCWRRRPSAPAGRETWNARTAAATSRDARRGRAGPTTTAARMTARRRRRRRRRAAAPVPRGRVAGAWRRSTPGAVPSGPSGSERRRPAFGPSRRRPWRRRGDAAGPRWLARDPPAPAVCTPLTLAAAPRVFTACK